MDKPGSIKVYTLFFTNNLGTNDANIDDVWPIEMGRAAPMGRLRRRRLPWTWCLSAALVRVLFTPHRKSMVIPSPFYVGWWLAAGGHFFFGFLAARLKKGRIAPFAFLPEPRLAREAQAHAKFTLLFHGAPQWNSLRM